MVVTKYIGVLAFILLALGSSGCATIFAPDTYILPVATDPPGATVALDDGWPIAVTPGVVPMPIDSEGKLTITKEGYETVEITREKHFRWAMFLWDVLGVYTMPITLTVDFATGEIWRFSTEPISIELVPVGKTAPAPADAGIE